MIFTIDIEDFWLHDGTELADELRRTITKDVVGKISTSIKEQVNAQISKQVEELIHSKIELIIDNTLSECIDNEVIAPHGKPVSITDHVKDLFMCNHGWNNPEKKLARLAKDFGEDLKLQYNNAFANKIVSNMKEQGLLKDEVVKILLEGK